MTHTPPQLPAPNRLTVWMLVFLPVLALVVSNADVLLLGLARPRADEQNLALVLGTTIPLSIAASGLTLWFMLHLRAEVDRRATAEQDARAALVELGKALDSERLLRRELDHRVRNNLSALLSLVGMYEETDATRAEMVSSLRSRVVALRESYSLITAAHNEGVELDALLHAVFAAVLGASPPIIVAIDGPSVRLSSREANAFAMIAQELLTNASKHGVLRAGPLAAREEHGTIVVTWTALSTADRVRVDFRWQERPVIGAPQPIRTDGGRRTPIGDTTGGAGLGLTLIEGFAAGDLRGQVSYGLAENTWSVNLVANVRLLPSVTSTRTSKEIPA